MADVNDKYKDSKLDDELKKGVTEKRGCRDIFCCLLFIASCVAMIAIGIVGYTKGTPKKLATPYDQDGRACGIDDAVKDYKYIYFVTPIPSYLERTVCVDKCPYISKSDQITESQNATQVNYTTPKRQLSCVPTSYTPSCQEDTSLYTLNIDWKFKWNEAPSINVTFASALNSTVFFYNSKLVFKKICMPEIQAVANYKNAVGDYLNEKLKTLEKWIADFKITWPILVAAPVAAVIICLLFMFFMRYCVGLITWLMIFSYFAILFTLGHLCYIKSKDVQAQNEADDDPSNDDNMTAQKVMCYVFYGIFGVSLILFICFYTRIKLAIAILKTASIFMGDVTSIIFVPIVNTIIIIGFWALWITSFVFLYSYGDISASKYHPFGHVTWEKNTRYMVIYYLIGGLWKNAFIGAVCQFILCSTVVLWYFGKNDKTCHKPISRSIYRAFRYHFGSLAFGALILAIVQFLRIVLLYVEQVCKKYTGTDNKFVKFLIWCSHCYLACLERFIRFINRQAYIQIAISGKSFCGAAREAFTIIMCNGARFLIVTGLGYIFVVVGRLIIAVATALAAYVVLTRVHYFDDRIHSPTFTTILVGIIGLVVGMLFLSIYGMAVDSILHCFIQEEALSKQDPTYAPKTPALLQDFIKDFEKKVKRAAKLDQIDKPEKKK